MWTDSTLHSTGRKAVAPLRCATALQTLRASRLFSQLSAFHRAVRVPAKSRVRSPQAHGSAERRPTQLAAYPTPSCFSVFQIHPYLPVIDENCSGCGELGGGVGERCGSRRCAAGNCGGSFSRVGLGKQSASTAMSCHAAPFSSAAGGPHSGFSVCRGWLWRCPECSMRIYGRGNSANSICALPTSPGSRWRSCR